MVALFYEPMPPQLRWIWAVATIYEYFWTTMATIFGALLPPVKVLRGLLHSHHRSHETSHDHLGSCSHDTLEASGKLIRFMPEQARWFLIFLENRWKIIHFHWSFKQWSGSIPINIEDSNKHRGSFATTLFITGFRFRWGPQHSKPIPPAITVSLPHG